MKRSLLALSLVGSLGAAATVSFVMTPTSAQAKGCGGYVNIAVWGCAPWDNNPPKKGVTPGYGTSKPAPKPVVHNRVPAPSVIKPGTPNVSSNGRLIGQDGAGLIGHDGGSLIGHDGGSFHRR